MTKGNKENKDFGTRILFLRKRAGLTQAEAAAKLGYKDRSAIAKIETGDCDIPIAKIPIFCEVLRCSPMELLGLPEDKTPVSSAEELARKIAPLPEWKRRHIERTIDALIIGMEGDDGTSNLER